MATLFKMDGTYNGHIHSFEVRSVSPYKLLKLWPSDFVFQKHIHELHDIAFHVSSIYAAHQTKPSGNTKFPTLSLVPLYDDNS